MKKVISLIATGLTAAGLYLGLQGFSSDKAQILHVERIVPNTSNFSQYKLKLKLDQRELLLKAAQKVREAKEDELEQIRSEVRFLEDIEQTFQTDGLQTGVYTDAAMYLMEYCQEVHAERFRNNKTLRKKLMKLFRDRDKSIEGRLEYETDFPGSEDFKCRTEVKDSLPDDEISTQVKGVCQDIDLLYSLRLSCAYPLAEHTPCGEDVESMLVKAYAEIFLYQDDPQTPENEVFISCPYQIQLVGKDLKEMAERDDIDEKMDRFLLESGYVEYAPQLKVPELLLPDNPF